MKILHIGGCDKFLPPFIELIKENFDFDQHEFLLRSGMGKAPDYPNVKVYERKIIERLKFYIVALLKMHRADKIILHGLFDIKLVFILFFTPWLLKKCYWVMWGGDLYVYKLGEKNHRWRRNELFRRPIIKNMGNLVTYIEGDVDLARKWYGAKGQYHECLMYSSNLYKEYDLPEKTSATINIQVGNSADPSNSHIDALKKLLPFKSDDICIYVPLSYGNQQHAQQVIKQGKEWFGDKFVALTDFMPFDEYLAFLGSIDIAIFNHKRQQAMGNTITLLGLGKTVYIRSDTTQWQFFKDKGLEINDIDKLSKLEKAHSSSNQEKVKEYFSLDNLIQQYERIFE